MPSGKTTNYQLSQWVKSDKVLMEDFNADNSKIDAAIKKVEDSKADKSALTSLETAVSTKADKSALTSLETTVSKKADQTALDDLKKTVTSHTTTLALKGNCRIELKTHTGNGANSRTYTFSKQPLMVVFWSDEDHLLAMRGTTSVKYVGRTSTMSVGAGWSGSSLTLTSSNTPSTVMNFANTSYQLLAFYDAEA